MIDLASIARELRREPALCSPEGLAVALGIERSKKERKKWHCPKCGGSSFSLRLARDHTLSGCCFGCDFTCDAIGLIREAKGVAFKVALQEGAAITGRHDILDAIDGRGGFKPSHPRPMPTVVERDYPDSVEVEAVWEASIPVVDDPEVSRYLSAERRLDPDSAWRLGVLRALRLPEPVPTWARFGSRSWIDGGYKIVSRWLDATGVMRSLRAWRIDGRTPKRIAPTGCRSSGLVLADLFGEATLRGEHRPRRVMIAEGEPDFVTLALRNPLTNQARRWATFGITSGSWTHDLARRIPDGGIVGIMTDRDDTGDKYARAIADSLGRRCDVRRLRGAAP